MSGLLEFAVWRRDYIVYGDHGWRVVRYAKTREEAERIARGYERKSLGTSTHVNTIRDAPPK